ncbi:MAG: trimethylamine methyltransferase family protein [Candidatus Thermoplasmatota archaeon]|nr:trimethylamine methyltransferase family protein [Candidatus Thermoplasmatota archaeon]
MAREGDVMGHTMGRGLYGMRPLDVMDPVDAEKIHVNSLHLLETMGIKVVSAEGLRLLKEAGAEVDEKAKIAKIPSYLVADAVSKCRRPVRLCARNPKNDMVLDGEHCHICTDGTGLSTIDLETGVRRDSTKKDVADSARVVDYLEMMNIYYPIVTPLDVPKHSHTLHEFDATFNNCEKHITSGATYMKEEAQYELKMAAAVAGGWDELKRRPLVSALTCTTSPMVLGMTTDAAIEFVRAGCPPMMMTMPLIGATSPMTVAGAILVGNAQVLALTTVCQLAAPGSPVCYSTEPMAMDIQSGLFEGLFPAANMVRAAHVQMARYYKIPIFVGGWGSCSKLPDAQAAYEKALSAFTYYLAGADITSGPGLLENWTVLSYEQLLIDYEMYTIMLDMLKGIEVNDDTMALDVIMNVGHEGHFLGKKHTLDHFKTMWQPMITDGQTYHSWKAAGSKSAADNARAKAKEILKTHEVTPLPDDVKKEFAAIIKEGEQKIPH